MRLPNVAHEAAPWRIRELAPDFVVEDVWALPAQGGPEDFDRLVELFFSLDPGSTGSLPLRVLWRARDRIGQWFGLGRISAPVEGGSRDGIAELPIPDTDETSLAARLPAELRGTAAGPPFRAGPFAPVYRTDVEFAAEVSNRTVHGVAHLGWADQGEGRYQGQLAVYVKPRGALGRGYLALIKPFRHWIVYRALMQQIERAWNTGAPADACRRPADRGGRLPPGQVLVGGFPRFGTHLSQPPPAVPADPVIAIRGVVAERFDLPLAALATLPRQELTADFHCVAGWSATDLRWAGVAFREVYRTFIEPALPPATPVSHVVFGGRDGFRSIVSIEDALADDVLIAEHLDGRPLDGDHGAPARLVSPNQYGYLSTKHLCRIEVHTAEPKRTYTSALDGLFWRFIGAHPRARVWAEERHPYLPPWSVRRFYRALIDPIARLSARGSREDRRPPQP